MPARKIRAAARIINIVVPTTKTQLTPTCHNGTVPKPHRRDMVIKAVVGKRERKTMSGWEGFSMMTVIRRVGRMKNMLRIPATCWPSCTFVTAPPIATISVAISP